MKKRLQQVYSKNTTDFNINKAIEELQELALILIQLKNKPLKVTGLDVSKEIADVKVRLPFLINHFGGKNVIRDLMKDKINLILK